MPSDDVEESDSPNPQTRRGSLLRNPTDSRLDKALGISMALLAGCFYSVNFVPLKLYIHRLKQSSLPVNELVETIRFIFSVYLGITVTSVIVFVTYLSLARKSSKLVEKEAWIWCLLSGIIWAIASIAA